MPGHEGIGIPPYLDSLNQFIFPFRSGWVGSHFTVSSPHTNVSCSKSMNEYFCWLHPSFSLITNLSISQVVLKSGTSSLVRPLEKTHVGTLIWSASNPVRAITLLSNSSSVVFSPELSLKRLSRFPSRLSRKLAPWLTVGAVVDMRNGGRVVRVRVETLNNGSVSIFRN